jgi:rSAM/selenodomain-associated transferase 1
MLFAKPAVPGRVKTRLIGALSAADTAQLQRAFTADLWRRMRQGDFRSAMVWALDAGEALPEEPKPATRQRGSDLGQRLDNALSEGLRDAEVAIVVGSDHPDLPLDRLETAFRWLEEGTDLVLGSSFDGGFYLIGVRRAAFSPALLEGVRWSSPCTLQDVLDRGARVGCTVRLLPAAGDVDEPADLQDLAQRIQRGEVTDCPDTAACLSRLSERIGSRGAPAVAGGRR